MYEVQCLKSVKYQDSLKNIDTGALRKHDVTENQLRNSSSGWTDSSP